MLVKLNPLQTQIPQSARLKNGTWVSNYHLLPADILTKEGWLTAEEVKPVCTETQTLVLDTAVQMKDRIVLTYKAVDNPPDPVTELAKYKTAVDKALAVNVTTALKDTLINTLNTLKADVAVAKEPIEIVKELTQ